MLYSARSASPPLRLGEADLPRALARTGESRRGKHHDGSPVHIRSVTIGVEVSRQDYVQACRRAGDFLARAKAALLNAGFSVQTTRLCTQPAHQLAGPDGFPAFARHLESACEEAAIDYCAAGGIALGGEWLEASAPDAVARAIAGTERFFTSIQLTGQGSVQPSALRASASAIGRISRTTQQGFGNLRFAASANCPPNGPFFPTAFHRGGPPRFSIAVQWADLLLEAVRGDDSLAAATRRVTETLHTWGRRVEQVARTLESELGIEYAGLDLSPAPFPSDVESAAASVEALGVDRFGAPGTLAAVSALTAALKAASLQRTGFSGLMLPLLEDSVLARRASAGLLSVSDLLLYSAVCGTGLDTVPLPGDVTETELAGILADVAALAVTLDKPLTARLLPVPGKAAGDMTDFSFPFFANARVLSVKRVGSDRLIERWMRPGA